MSAVSGGGGNYISDGQIMAWLASEQDRIYGDLKESMDLSDKRAEFTDALTKIKAHLPQANASHDFGQVDQELQDLMTKYGSDPDFSSVCKDLEGMATKIHTDRQAQLDHAQYAKDPSKYTKTTDPHGLSRAGTPLASSPGLVKLGASPLAPQSYSDVDLKSFETLIDGKTDLFGKNDQLTMIHIQELKATLDQGAQLGSTFISSGDKTSSAIINNIA